MSRKEELEVQRQIAEFIGGETDNDKMDELILQFASEVENEHK